MGKTRIILIAIAALVAFICLGIIGVRTVVHAIYTERDCDWANIDNIEMHAKIDIPEIENCDCDFTADDNVKRAVFTIDKSVDIEEFALGQKLAVASPPYSPALSSVNGLPAKNALWVRSGNSYDSNYEVALEPGSRKMWVYIRYKH